MGAHCNNRYSQLLDETLGLWEKYQEKYCCLLEDYEEALAAKTAANIKIPQKLGGRPIKKSELRQFPVITLLCIDNKDDAEEYLLNLTESRLIFVQAQILLFFEIDPKLYNDLVFKADLYRRKIAEKEKKEKSGSHKRLYAVDPASCSSGRRYGKHLEREF